MKKKDIFPGLPGGRALRHCTSNAEEKLMSDLGWGAKIHMLW